MFDANMSYLPKGAEFFAKVYHCKKGSTLHNLGVRGSDIVRCTMLTDDIENPNVAVKLGSGDHELFAGGELEDEWLVFEGMQDGQGFLDEASKKFAMAMLDNT
jgi:hypothetical protein